MKTYFTFFSLLVLAAISLEATVYTTITGAFIDWEVPTSWLGGVVPPEPIPAGDVVVIQGKCWHGPGSVTNNGTMIIKETGQFYFGNSTAAGVVFVNHGLLIVDGTLLTSSSNWFAVSNYTANTGTIDINGLWRNTGEYDNSGDIYLQTEGIFSNYQVSSGSGLTICYTGTVNNSGNFFLNGGARLTDDCGGGFWTGNAEISGACGKPAAVVAYIDATDDLVFRWVRVKDDEGYKVGAIETSSGARRIVDVAPNSKEFSFSAGMFPTGLTLQYGVMSYCSPGLVDLTNLLMSGTTVNTKEAFAQNDLFDQLLDQIEVFPNPAHNTLQIAVPGESESELYFSLSNLAGQVVKSGVLQHSVTSINIESLNAGIYHFHFRSGEQHSYSKLVVR